MLWYNLVMSIFIQHRESKNWFEVYDIDQPPQDFDLDIVWGKERGATHIVRVSSLGSGIMSCFRFGKVKKTVAYIGVDETDTGDIKWEKWRVKQV